MLRSTERIEDAKILAQAIVNTIPEPFLVLDERFHVLAASRSFYETFKVDPDQTHGCLLYNLGNGQWDIPALRLLLETIIPERAAMDGFEVEHDFPEIGRKTMLLNARKVLYEDSPNATILLAFSDVTTRRAIEHEKQDLLERTEELLRQKQVLLQEMEHRVANSLSIIASILILKARAVTSEETRRHLQDAHQRVMSVAEVQLHLHASKGIDRIEVDTYLAKLCGALASSMITEQHPILVKVAADKGTVDSSEAVSLGLIVTELVINAIKYAFPVNKSGAQILITYEIDKSDWKLVISDNGVGKDDGDDPRARGGGLGTTIVNALAKQLGANVETESSAAGLKVSVARVTSTPGMLRAA
jgi:chemotaxis protein methyltransferase CheR